MRPIVTELISFDFAAANQSQDSRLEWSYDGAHFRGAGGSAALHKWAREWAEGARKKEKKRMHHTADRKGTGPVKETEKSKGVRAHHQTAVTDAGTGMPLRRQCTNKAGRRTSGFAQQLRALEGPARPDADSTNYHPRHKRPQRQARSRRAQKWKRTCKRQDIPGRAQGGTQMRAWAAARLYEAIETTADRTGKGAAGTRRLQSATRQIWRAKYVTEPLGHYPQHTS